MIEMDEDTDRLLERLYTEKYEDMFKYVDARIKDKDRVQDVVQEAFLTAVKKVDSVNLSPNPEGWLKNALKNALKHEFRDWNKATEATLSLESMDETAVAVIQSYDEVELEDIKAKFSADEWWLLNAFYLEGRKYAEIARELGIEYDACRKRVNRVRDKAAMLWGSDLNGD
jgi:RNA polymerase sigma factor (sigma-70 family)